MEGGEMTMTKRELINALSKWPDDAQIELAIAVDVDAENLKDEDKVWLEIDEVEIPSVVQGINTNKHCLIYGGKVMMS